MSSSAASVLIAAASNNLAKGIYPYIFSERKVGLQSLGLLSGLGLAGLAPVWLLA